MSSSATAPHLLTDDEAQRIWSSASTVLLKKLKEKEDAVGAGEGAVAVAGGGAGAGAGGGGGGGPILVDYGIFSTVFMTKGDPLGKGATSVVKGINPFAPTEKSCAFTESMLVLATRVGGERRPTNAIDADFRRLFKARVRKRNVHPKLGGSYEVTYDVSFVEGTEKGVVYRGLPPSSLAELKDKEGEDVDGRGEDEDEFDERPESREYGTVRREAPNMHQSLIETDKLIKDIAKRVVKAEEQLPPLQQYLKLLSAAENIGVDSSTCRGVEV